MKGKGIVKKIIASIILTVMIFASCSQTLSYAITVTLTKTGYTLRDSNRNNTNESIEKFNIAEDNVNIDNTMDIYCLRGGANVQEYETGYEKTAFLKENASATEISNFEATTGVKFRTAIINKPETNLYRYNFSNANKVSSVNAINWLIKNIYLSSDVSESQKKFCIDNISDIIKKLRNKIYIGNSSTAITDSQINDVISGLNNLEEQEFNLLQQFVFWHFEEDNNNYTNIEIKKWQDVKKLENNGTVMSDEKAKAGFVLYQALLIGAIEYANGNKNISIYSKTDNTFQIKLNSENDREIHFEKIENNKYKYYTDVMLLDQKNTDKIDTITLGLRGISDYSWNIKMEAGSTLLTSAQTGSVINLKDNGSVNSQTLSNLLAGKSFKIEFETNTQIEKNPNATIQFFGSYKATLSDYSSNVYYKQNKQPLLGIHKQLYKYSIVSGITLGFDGEYEMDLALTKQIVNIYRYNRTSKKYNEVYEKDLNRLVSAVYDNEGNGTYKMNKESVSVLPGDIVRYKITLYNEGEVNGYVRQVTDYLPMGLEYSKTVKGVQANQSNIQETLSDSGKSTVKYNMDTVLIKPGENKEIFIECQVTDNAKLGTVLRNVAFISDYGYKNNGVYTQAINTNGTVVDRDSVQNNIGEGVNYDDSFDSINRKIGQTIENLYLKEINKQLSGILEDDEDFEQIKVGNFDLALRKFISKNGDTVITERTPAYNAAKLANEEETTAIYKHTKKPIEVKAGSSIIYTIRVYNENDIDGVVKEIRDYLPEGLTLKTNSTINGTKWKTNGNYIYTEEEKTIPGAKGSKLNYVDYRVECEVGTNVNNDTILRNVAEISNYGYYYLDTYKGCSNEGIDRDSEQANVFSKRTDVKNISNYYEKVISTQSNKENYLFYKGLQDDDDFESIIIKGNTFDLALRKYIKKIERNGEEIQITASREPVVDPANILTNGTAIYKHPKNPLTVEKGDIITYGIKVYNEGYLKGKVNQITDYLPEGLNYYEEANDGWTQDANNNRILTYNTPFTLEASNRFEISANDSNSKEITVKCIVTSIINDAILTNVAEISDYEDINGNKANTETKADIDSQYDGNGKTIDRNSNISIDDQIKAYYSARRVNEIYPKEAYTGKQDDDDFESVKVEALYSNKLTLIKTDNTGNEENSISDAEFKVGHGKIASDILSSLHETTISANTASSIKAGIKNMTDGDSGIDVIRGRKSYEKDNLTVGNNYFYALQEVQSPEGYVNVLQDCIIVVLHTIDENGLLKLGTTNDAINESYPRGYLLLKENEDGTYTVLNNNDDLYNKFTVELVTTGEIPEIKVIVKNPELKGAYNLYIKKVDKNSHTIKGEDQGLAFEYERKEYNEASELVNTKSKTLAIKNDGFRRCYNIAINSKGEDKIELNEIVLQGHENNKYVELKDTIKLAITKDVKNVDGEDVYYISDIRFEDAENIDDPSPDQNITKQIIMNAKLVDGTDVVVRARLNENKNYVTVVVWNHEVKGSYGLKLEKVGEKAEDKLDGVKFKVTDKDDNVIGDNFVTGTDGTVTILENNPVTEEGIDYYDITELETKSGYLNLNKAIRVYVKKSINGNEFKIEYSLEPFEADKENVLEKDGIKLEVDDDANVKVVIPNDEIRGSYLLRLRKVENDEENTPISGIGFKVYKNNVEATTNPQTTNSYGRVNVIVNGVANNKITSETVNTVDEFKITEINLNNKPYITLKEDEHISLFVHKDQVGDKYKAVKISFDENEEGAKTITKEVTLADNSKVNIKAEILTNYILLTIPNIKITGSYGLEILKTKEDGDSPLEGAKFTVTKGDGENAETIVDNQETDENGEILVLENEEITAEDVNTKDIYTIKENSTDSNYLKMIDELKVYVTKKLNDTKTAYILDKVSFENEKNEEEKEVTLSDGSKLTVRAEIVDGKVLITIPNKEIKGKYSLEILKTGEGDNPLKGVEFKVFEGEALREIKDETTGENGKITVFTDREINSGNKNIKEMFTIKEEKTDDSYSELSAEFKIYVTKRKNDAETAYIIDTVSFEEDSEVTTKTITLKNDKVVVVTLQKTENLVTVTVPNKEIEGKYGLEILKTGEANNPLKGVEFKVTEETKDNSEQNEEERIFTTGDDGKVTIFADRKITAENVDKQDIYEITEVKADSNYVVLPKPIKIYVVKEIDTDGKSYVVSKASFEEISDENSSIVTTKDITLANGKVITTILGINGNMVTLTIPNNKIEGKYDLELLKTEIFEGAIEGVTFDIKTMKGSEEVKLYDVNGTEINTKGLTTDKDGKITIPNVKITEGANYNFEITETKVPNGFVMLKDKIKLTFTTKVDAQKQAYVLENVKLTGEAELNANSNKIAIKVKNGQFDLALRKYISKVTVRAGENDEKSIQVPNRVPVFKVDENGNYVYEHSKETVVLGSQNIVEYTLRVYNEGSISGYAKEIKDDIPEGLEFLPDNNTNKKYGWRLLDEKGNEVKEVNKAKYIVTNYLSKENEKTSKENLIKAFNTKEFKEGKITEPDYKEVKVAFKVTIPSTDDRVIINKAQISDDSDETGEPVDDKDSTPDKWIEGEDDQDIEKVRVQYFDLALRKWVTKAIVIEDGKQTVTETGHKAEDDPEEIVKVDLKNSKINNVVVKFEYKIRVTNEGQIAGYAKEISDYIPQGLKFDAADNPNWKEQEGKIITEELKDKLLNPGESQEVSVMLTWINRKDNLGLKQNVAEISKDYNIYGSPDIDSIPNNKVPGEDDIDDAPVMLTIKTGQSVIYVGLIVAVVMMIGSGAVLIKKFVLK